MKFIIKKEWSEILEDMVYRIYLPSMQGKGDWLGAGFTLKKAQDECRKIKAKLLKEAPEVTEVFKYEC